ncbi:ATP-grasp domain-containing protein [Streptomyces sp. WMMC940]|uniref:ATP-grasp domain-containing protein n=1 Tax=Streptomyces sp. WMMC940 TaxID=3015153 RepID=UPI0022B6C09F|nr:ATP-grasp domain-containing protein [Streptomyces sp. WMMC940]MCZ7462275.1 ATP-grasp domain-containing protein [Streptomyces sp. WMMC940]
MKTVVVISTRGFGVFRHDLLVEPDQVRFVGIFSEQDSVNVSDTEGSYFHRIHVVPCGLDDPSYTESSIVDPAATRAIVHELAGQSGTGELTLHCFDERNLLLTAELREELGLPGPTYEQLLPYRDKCLMKERLAGTGLRVPRFGRFDEQGFRDDPAACLDRITADVGMPFVLKPVDAASADGVYKIFSADEFFALPHDLGRSYEYEEHIDGTMYSVNLVVKDGRTVFGGVTEYLVNSTEVQRGRVNADINLIDTDPRVPRMIAFAETVLEALGKLDGASHLELFHTAEDELVFLEVGARFKGLAGLAAMQQNYQVALLNLAFEIEAGLKSHPWDQEQMYCFDAVMPKRPGIVSELVEPEVESEVEIKWKVTVGEEIKQGASLIDNGGTFLVRNHDYETLYRDFERLATYQPIRYEDQRRGGPGK